MAAQLVSCGVLPPGLVQDCLQHSCVIAVQLLLEKPKILGVYYFLWNIIQSKWILFGIIHTITCSEVHAKRLFWGGGNPVVIIL